MKGALDFDLRFNFTFAFYTTIHLTIIWVSNSTNHIKHKNRAYIYE